LFDPEPQVKEKEHPHREVLRVVSFLPKDARSYFEIQPEASREL